MHVARIVAALLALAPAALSAAVEGVVRGTAGAAVEHAWVGTDATSTHTNAEGRFHLDLEPPVTLIVHHPRFEPLEVPVVAGTTTVEVVLVAKQAIFEEIVVAAQRGSERVAPLSVATSTINPVEDDPGVATLTEAIALVPGVAENGQGGIFQTYSVRGVSRYRVLTLVAGMPIVAERRAGVSVSWIDPELMGAAEIIRGPASTWYGSGALGGVVQVLPRTDGDSWGSIGYSSIGNERRIAGGAAGGGWTLGLAYRTAADAEAVDGSTLNSHFTQASATISKIWTAGQQRYELTLIPTYGSDIGKANTRFPEQTTTYPRERHLLASLLADFGHGWRVRVAAHPNDLVTREDDLENGVRSEVKNEAFDYTVNVDREKTFANGLFLHGGIDWFTRRGVTAEERTFDPLGATEATDVVVTLDDAQRDDVAGFVTLRGSVGRVTLLGGGRVTWQQQENAGFAPRTDTAVNGFVGAIVPLGHSIELAANLGTGLRFPSLSELFFTGTTGSGGVIGNPELESERALNADLGLRYYGRNVFFSGSVFRNEIDDFIERVEVTEDLLTFVNLTSGTIDGVELEGNWTFQDQWQIFFTGQWIEGRSDQGEPLTDIPANRTTAGLRWGANAWTAEARWQHRFEKVDPGAREQPTPAANLVFATVRWTMRPGLRLNLTGRNLLDETYFTSADRRVPLAPGRSFGLSVDLTFH